jgi:hypothetical protein
MAGMLVVMWVQRPSAGCALPTESPQRLVLTRETDREHLTRDLAWVDRIAQRYAASTPSDDRQHDRFLACQATLVQELAARHALSPDQLRAGQRAAASY